MKWVLFIVLLTLSCTGVSQQQKDMATAQLESEFDYCVMKYRYDTFTHYTECMNQAKTNF